MDEKRAKNELMFKIKRNVDQWNQDNLKNLIKDGKERGILDKKKMKRYVFRSLSGGYARIDRDFQSKIKFAKEQDILDLNDAAELYLLKDDLDNAETEIREAIGTQKLDRPRMRKTLSKNMVARLESDIGSLPKLKDWMKKLELEPEKEEIVEALKRGNLDVIESNLNFQAIDSMFNLAKREDIHPEDFFETYLDFIKSGHEDFKEEPSFLVPPHVYNQIPEYSLKLLINRARKEKEAEKK